MPHNENEANRRRKRKGQKVSLAALTPEQISAASVPGALAGALGAVPQEEEPIQIPQVSVRPGFRTVPEAAIPQTSVRPSSRRATPTPSPVPEIAVTRAVTRRRAVAPSRTPEQVEVGGRLLAEFGPGGNLPEIRGPIEGLLDGRLNFTDLPNVIQARIRRTPGLLDQVISMQNRNRETQIVRDLARQSRGRLEATEAGRLRPTALAQEEALAGIEGKRGVARTPEELEEGRAARAERREASAPVRAEAQARAVRQREVRLAGGPVAFRKRARREFLQDEFIAIQKITAAAQGGGARGPQRPQLDPVKLAQIFGELGVPAEELAGVVQTFQGILGGQPTQASDMATLRRILGIPAGETGNERFERVVLLLGLLTTIEQIPGKAGDKLRTSVQEQLKAIFQTGGQGNAAAQREKARKEKSEKPRTLTLSPKRSGEISITVPARPGRGRGFGGRAIGVSR